MPYTSFRDFIRSSEAWGIIIGAILSILSGFKLIPEEAVPALKTVLVSLAVYVSMRLTSKTVKVVIPPKLGA
jgi:hypothetical protein